MTVKFIAEVSSNHHQDLKRCIKFIEKASEIGCDAVKFQSFKVEKLFAKEILNNSPSHLERKKWELSDDFIDPLKKAAKKYNIEFACTPFDLEIVDLLQNHVDFFKIASYELLWDDLLVKCAQTGLPIYLSTGMANMQEIIHAVNVIKDSGCEEPTLLHCVSSYPAPIKECNLAAIESIRSQTSCSVGWSDHSHNRSVIERAIHHWNASVVEFHLDLDGLGDEFSPGHCWLPSEMEPIITSYKKSLLADGSGLKEPKICEFDDRLWRADPKDGLRPLIIKRREFLDSFSDAK